jgi:elongation factor G
MRKHAIEQLRNLALIGHGGSGKTSLAEAMLFDAGVIERLGATQSGTTVSDSDPDEVARQISISAALLPLEWKGCKLNVMDTPGYADFMGEVIACLRVADAAVLVVDALSGIEVQAERYWHMAVELGLPRLVVLNKLDKEHTDFGRALDEVRRRLRCRAVLLNVPLGDQDRMSGVVDLLTLQAHRPQSAAEQVAEAPAEAKAKAETYREQFVEAAAESDDELTAKYLEEETLSDEEVRHGLRAATLAGGAVPVVCCAATGNLGVISLLDAIIAYLPSPSDRPPAGGINPRTQAEETREASADAPLAALVFKTMADPYAGRLTLFRTYSGVLAADATVYNAKRESRERIAQPFFPHGKGQEAAPAVSAGDVGVLAKLHETLTGDTLCDDGQPILLPAPKFPDPVYSLALRPKSKGDEDKVGSALNRLMEEDPTLRVSNDPRTRETILSGLGDLHLEVTVDRLKRKFGVEVETGAPKVAYLETARTSVRVQGRHKKQSGGRGQYGDVWVILEPLERGGGFEFVNGIVGGVIPRNFIPAVERGVREAMERGVIAGCPVTDIRIRLVDGSHHSVDSSDLAFKIAGSLALQKAVQEADPVLLEPVMEVEVVVPDSMMGDIMGALSGKRGRILGAEPAALMAGGQAVRAHVPLAEMFTYASELRSMTGGRGSYAMKFSHYEELPPHLAQPIISKAQQEREEGREAR